MKNHTGLDNATARPWKRIEDHGSYWILGNEQTDKGTIAIASITNWEKTETAKANAALIVKAVNRDHAFDALVEALENIIEAETRYRLASYGYDKVMGKYEESDQEYVDAANAFTDAIKHYEEIKEQAQAALKLAKGEA